MFMQHGIDIPANTLGNWVMQSGEALSPLALALKAEINNTNNLQADETPVTVLSQKSKGYMWCYHSCKPEDRFVLFEYSNNRSSDTVNATLVNYEGILQTDGYDGYNQMRKKEEIISIGCMAHCRRKFAEIIKIGLTGKADEVIAYIKKLYEVEAKAREEKLDFNARKELRQKYAKPILDEMLTWLQKTEPLAPPKSALGAAITYALNQWKYLCRYVEYGEAEIDNNLAENQIRPFALGRKNWMFIGNENAANTAALLYSLIQTCKLHGINARAYLTYVLNQSGRMLRKEVDPKSLLPQFIDKTLLC
jgi:transposase